MNVPFLDLKSQYEKIAPEIEAVFRRVMEKTAFSGGPFVEEFEGQFADFTRSRFAIGVGSGTEALWLALLGLGIGRGDEVITVPNTFIATAEAISLCGATPVFVDVEEDSYTMDPALLEAAITPRTKAVIPVHLFGRMADMDRIMDVARRHGLLVVEDACQAHGAEHKGRRAGSIGDAGCFSFYPGKNLGAYGEAGGVVTNDRELATKIRMLRDHGQPKKYSHAVVGVNSRMDGLQGAVLGVKLKYLLSWNEARMRNAERYRTLLDGVAGVTIPREAGHGRHVYHIFPVTVKNRDPFLAAMTGKGVSCGIHYPVPVHLQEAYRFMGLGEGSFPVAERCAREEVSLPMYPEMRPEQIEYTATAVREYFRSAPQP